MVVRIEPGPGQESVWDYPRPPRVEPVPERLRVVVGGTTVADPPRGSRVSRTAAPPSSSSPPDTAGLNFSPNSPRWRSGKWRAGASYHSLAVGGREIENIAWSYDEPKPGYGEIQGYLAFYAAKVDEAWVGDEQATPQAGGFYGGWVTSKIVGPMKGEPGSEDW